MFNAINNHGLKDDFSVFVEGFADTLKIIRQKSNEKKCSLSELAKNLHIDSIGAHNAMYDCEILYKILKSLKISNASVLEYMVPFQVQTESWL